MPCANAGRLLTQGYDMGLFREGTQIFGSGHMTNSCLWQQMMPALRDVILKGYICVIPAFGMNISYNQGFVNRWRAQRSTIRTFCNGTVSCDQKRDDEGQPVYVTDSGCSGLTYNSFSDNGSDLAPYAPYSYDATYALAHALHYVLYVRKRPTVSSSALANALQCNTCFQGVTGLVSFRYGDTITGNGCGDHD